MKIVPAKSGDLPALFALLEDSDLPTMGLTAHLVTTLVAHDGERLVGSAALELYGTDARLALGCRGCSAARAGVRRTAHSGCPCSCTSARRPVGLSAHGNCSAVLSSFRLPSHRTNRGLTCITPVDRVGNGLPADCSGHDASTRIIRERAYQLIMSASQWRSLEEMTPFV